MTTDTDFSAGNWSTAAPLAGVIGAAPRLTGARGRSAGFTAAVSARPRAERAERAAEWRARMCLGSCGGWRQVADAARTLFCRR